MGIVLDISNHDYSTFDPTCFARAGVERVIVNAWAPSISIDMIRRCRAVGIICEDIYCFLYFGLSHERVEVHNALNIARQVGGIKRIWLDVEARPPHEREGMTPEGRIAAVRECVRMIEQAGYRPGIYTGLWYWVPYMGNTTEFAHLPLWYANYGDNSGNRPPIRGVNFGGWKTVAVHQYTSNLPVCGRRRDANYWMLNEGKEEHMTPQEIVNAILNDNDARNALIAAIMADGPIHLELDAAKQEAWQRVLLSRLNEVLQRRFELMRLALETNAAVVEDAVCKLK